MIRPSAQTPQVWLHVEPVDFRKQIAGLAAIVESDLERDPFADAIYGFTNKRRNQCRLLTWERNGFILWGKRLEKGRFHWPSCAEAVVALSANDLNFLLDGYDIVHWQPHPTLHFVSVA